MDDEHEKERMKETTNKLANLISSLNIGSEEMLIEDYVQLARKEIVDANYIMTKLVDLAWDIEVHLGVDLNEEPMVGNDVNDQPTPVVKLPQTRKNAQLL